MTCPLLNTPSTHLCLSVKSSWYWMRNCVGQWTVTGLEIMTRQGATKQKFPACPWGQLQLRPACAEFILTCLDVCAISLLLWLTKGNHLLISLKYHSVKCIFLKSRAHLYLPGGQVARKTCLPRTRTHLPWASGQGFCRALPGSHQCDLKFRLWWPNILLMLLFANGQS